MLLTMRFANEKRCSISRLNRSSYRPVTVDLPSPVDSGIGNDIMITPKQEPMDGSQVLLG